MVSYHIAVTVLAKQGFTHLYKHTNMPCFMYRHKQRLCRRQSRLMSLRLLNQTKNLPSMNEYKWVKTWVREWDHSWGGIWRTALWWAAGLVRKGKIFNVEERQYRTSNGCRAARYVQNIMLFLEFYEIKFYGQYLLHSCFFYCVARDYVMLKLY